MSISEQLSQQRQRRFEFLALAVGVLTVSFAYLDSLDGPFVWDDRTLLDQNCIRSFCSIGEYFKLPFWDLGAQSPGAGLLYRPVTSFSLALDQVIHGQNASGFHLTNIAFHLLNMTLFAALARRLGANGFVAAAFATVWALLPRLSESVAWISGRTDILYTTAASASLLLWQAEHKSRRYLAIAVGLVSPFAKEAGIGVLMGLFLAEVLASPPGKRIRRSLAPAALLLGYLWLRHTVLSVATPDATVPLSLPKRVLTVLEATGRYAWMSLDPWHPKSQIGVVGEPRLGYAALGVATILAIGVILHRARRNTRPLPLAVVITGAVPMLSVIHLIPMPWIAVAGDRLSYLSWGIAACGLAVAVTKLGSRIRYGVPSAILISAILAATLIPRVSKRVHLFADEIELWTDMLETTAGANWGPTISVSGLYLRGGWPERSLAIVDSLERRCPSPIALNLAGPEAKALARQGKYREAQTTLDAATPDRTPGILLMNARSRLNLLDVEGAEADARASLELSGQYYEAKQFLRTLERVRQVKSRLEGARTDLDRAILGAQIDMLSGRLVEAEREWLSLLGVAGLPKAEADEAIAFICEFGSAGTLRPSIDAYRKRQDAVSELIGGCLEKLKYSERLDSIWPQVSRVLDAKNSNRGHCQNYGPFSD